MEQNMSDALSHYDAFDFETASQDAASVHAHEGTKVSVRDLTRLLQVDCPDEAWLARTTFALRRVREGEALVHAGEKFHSLYVVRSGCFKTVYTDLSGSEQVLGFPMCGDVMGADGIDTGQYGSTAVSLDTSEVVIVPFSALARLTDECPQFETLLYRVLSRELVRVQTMAWTLGTLGAEGRVAAFLLALSARLGELGYSRKSFNLRMTRHEIGSYLGLQLETVSRALSALNASGVIEVRQRSVDIVNPAGLRGVIDPSTLVARKGAPPPEPVPARSATAHARRVRMLRPRFQPPAGFAWQQFAAA